jgi:hypothetical protein
MCRNIKFVIFFTAGIFISFVENLSVLSQSQIVSQTNSTTSQSSSEPNALWSGLTIAIVSAILGFLASVAVESIKKRSEPRKQISYTKDIKSGIVGSIEEDIESKVSILYDGKPAKNMFCVLFDIENTGNRQVKNQEIRFEFIESIEILDSFFEPQKIPPEMDFEEIKISNLSENEKKYRIGTIKPQEKLGFRFIVQTSENKIATLKHYTKSDEDVSFIAREAKKVADDIDQVKAFLSLLLTFFVLLPLLQNLWSRNMFIYHAFRELGGLVISLIALVGFVFLILPRFGRFIEAVVNLLSGSSRPDIQAERVAFIALEGSNVIVDKVTMADDGSTPHGS